MKKRTTALQATYEKDRLARISKKGILDYPYLDKRSRHGAVTWARAFIRAWQWGWSDEDRRLRKMGKT